MAMLNINNVVTISVLVPPAGLPNYSINNLVCFTRDTPAVSLGTDLYRAYATAADVFTDWGASDTYNAAVSVFSQSPNILTGGGLFLVVPMLAGEVLGNALNRAQAYAYFGGCAPTFASGASGMSGYTGATAANLEYHQAAETAQAAGKLLFLSTDDIASLTTGGLAHEVHDEGLSLCRVLHHTVAAQIKAFKWAYASRGMSTNFAGSNTASTLHLKSLAGVSADDGLTQNIYNSAAAVGADIYANVAGVACVQSFGENEFFDDVYNLRWIVGALEVAGFNYLRQSSTKIPQTEIGMDGLKAAYRRVCAQAITNGFIAAGLWTGSDTFGDPQDFNRNISDFGYYIWSLPVAQQPVADRNSRIAPIIQIALKYRGALHHTDVIVTVNK